MMYFTHFASHNKASNALQRAAVELLKENSNRLILNQDKRNDLVLSLEYSIEVLNQDHSRCTPLHFSMTEFNGDLHIWLGDTFTVSFTIYPVKNTEVPE